MHPQRKTRAPSWSHWRWMTAAVMGVLLSLAAPGPASSSPLSVAEIHSYLDAAGVIPNLPETVLVELLNGPSPVSGVTWGHALEALIGVDHIAADLSQGEYLKALLRAEHEAIGLVLAGTPLAAAAEIAGLANLPVSLGLLNIAAAVQQGTLNGQMRAYLELRRAGIDKSFILEGQDNDAIGVAFYRDGWIYIAISRTVNYPTGFEGQSRMYFEAWRQEYDAAQRVPDFVTEKDTLLAQLRQDVDVAKSRSGGTTAPSSFDACGAPRPVNFYPYRGGTFAAAVRAGDEVGAARIAQQALSAGDPDAERLMAAVFLYGLGASKSCAEALAWLRKGALRGHASSQTSLAYMLYHGYGERRDLGEALSWVRRAADQGYALAQAFLGVALFRGEGAPQSATDAAGWFRRAADQGMPYGQMWLGYMHQIGAGVPKDLAEAHRWYDRAAAASDDPDSARYAAERIKELDRGG
jgi:hypothetical protein